MNLNIKINKSFEMLYTDKIDKYREIIFYGGRGGSKTFEVTQFLIIRALKEKCNILCLREFSKSNKNSLLSEFKQFIYNNDLEINMRDFVVLNKNEKAIKIMATEISFLHNGSKIIFTGINDNTVMSIKSISNINLCWVEEANFLSEHAYSILKPTIRADNSKLIFTFNPQSKEDFLYKKIQKYNKNVYVKKVNWSDNAFLPKVLNEDRKNDFKTMPRELYLHIWEGEPLELNESQVINTDLIGFFDDTEAVYYDETFITADTAYSKNESADYSVIGCFGKKGDEIHLIRIYRGKWVFNELLDVLKQAYLFLSNHKVPSNVLIEKKASGISLIQELTRLTNLPIKEVIPKSDKYTRLSDVLSELPRLRLPLDKDNPLNSWISDFLLELKMFRGDMKHEHDDQVDVLCYALAYCKNNKVNWADVANML